MSTLHLISKFRKVRSLAVGVAVILMTLSISRGQDGGRDIPATDSTRGRDQSPSTTGGVGTEDPENTGDQGATGVGGDMFPHLRIDRERGWVDIDATVVLKEGDWLELLACTPGTRTHESVLAVHAVPSHVHLALVMLGIEPGRPMRWDHDGKNSNATPPHGPKVAVTILMDRDGQEVEIPANRWILDQGTNRPIADNHWIFTGSFTHEYPDIPPYHADSSGSVISIVNFGDEVLARPTDRTHFNDARGWGPNVDQIPPLGTEVVIRLRPVNALVSPSNAPSDPDRSTP